MHREDVSVQLCWVSNLLRAKEDESLKVPSKTNFIFPKPWLRDLLAKLYTQHLCAQGMVNLYGL